MRSAAVARYCPPGQKARKIPLGPRQVEMLRLLHAAPATRVALLQRGRPRMGLSAPQIIEKLRRKGFHITSVWLHGIDGQGEPCRYVSYRLRGRLLGIQ